MNGRRPTKKELIDFMNNYKEDHGHYPTNYEFDSCPTKPCSIRTIERHYGGYVQLKKDIGIELPNDSVGEKRAEIASIAMSNSLDAENESTSSLVHTKKTLSVTVSGIFFDLILIHPIAVLALLAQKMSIHFIKK